MLVRNENIKLFAPPVLPIDRSDRRTSLYGSGQTCFMENVEEIWKDVVGHEGHYLVSSVGRIYSIKSRKYLTLRKHNQSDYKTIMLCMESKPVLHLVHRLVAISFIPNPGNKPQVNHINGVKTDNRIQNLEWATSGENIRHAYETGLRDRRLGRKSYVKKEVFHVAQDGSIKTWESMTAAAKEIGVTPGAVWLAIKQNREIGGIRVRKSFLNAQTKEGK